MKEYICESCGSSICPLCFYNEICEDCGIDINQEMLDEYYMEVWEEIDES